MSDRHDRFRASLAAHLAEVLPEDDSAWMEEHARECPSCADLQARVSVHLPELKDDEGHVPVSLLESWARESTELPPLERHLIERHLSACTTCRAEAEEMARLSGVVGTFQPRPSAWRRWRAPLVAALVAAAALTVVFAIRLENRMRPNAPEAPATPRPRPSPTRGEMMLVPRETQTIQLLDRARGTSGEALPEAMAPGPPAGLRLRLPPLFLDDDRVVLVRLLREDGAVVWETRVPGRALREDLAPTPGAAEWSAGRYRLLVIPREGRDSAATREFGFRLRESAAP